MYPRLLRNTNLFIPTFPHNTLSLFLSYTQGNTTMLYTESILMVWTSTSHAHGQYPRKKHWSSCNCHFDKNVLVGKIFQTGFNKITNPCSFTASLAPVVLEWLAAPVSPLAILCKKNIHQRQTLRCTKLFLSTFCGFDLLVFYFCIIRKTARERPESEMTGNCEADVSWVHLLQSGLSHGDACVVADDAQLNDSVSWRCHSAHTWG